MFLKIFGDKKKKERRNNSPTMTNDMSSDKLFNDMWNSDMSRTPTPINISEILNDINSDSGSFGFFPPYDVIYFRKRKIDTYNKYKKENVIKSGKIRNFFGLDKNTKNKPKTKKRIIDVYKKEKEDVNKSGKIRKFFGLKKKKTTCKTKPIPINI